MDPPASLKISLASGLALVLALCARLAAPPAPDVRDRWANETLASRTLGEKVGQMILARPTGSFCTRTHQRYKRWKTPPEAGRIGGVVFFQGDLLATAVIANRLQTVAPVPMLMASDCEWGAAFRIRGATWFPSAMAIGPGGSEDDVRFQAEVTASRGACDRYSPGLRIGARPQRERGEFGHQHAFLWRGSGKSESSGNSVHCPGSGEGTACGRQALPRLRGDRRRLSPISSGASLGADWRR